MKYIPFLVSYVFLYFVWWNTYLQDFGHDRAYIITPLFTSWPEVAFWSFWGALIMSAIYKLAVKILKSVKNAQTRERLKVLFIIIAVYVIGVYLGWEANRMRWASEPWELAEFVGTFSGREWSFSETALASLFAAPILVGFYYGFKAIGYTYLWNDK